MAMRYSGDVVVRLTYRDGPEDYSGRVYVARGRDHHAWTFDGLRLSPFLRERIAADSPEAYDEAARAAIGFCTGWCEYDAAGAPVDGGPTRETREAVSCGANDPDGTGARVSRRWRDRWGKASEASDAG